MGLLNTTFANVDVHNPLADLSFQAGEKITYKLFYNWNFIWLSAGEVVFEVKDEGDVYHLEVTGKTYASYEWFFKVRDKYHSYIDKATLKPKLYIRDVHQGNYLHYEKIVFDYANKKATSYTGKSMTQLNAKVIDIDDNLYDMVTLMYFLRQTDLYQFRQNKKLNVQLLLDNEKYNLGMNYKKDETSLSVKENGKFKAISTTADVVSGNVFKEGAQMKLWIADDKNKIPVLIESPLSVGSVKVVLKTHENLKYPLDSKIK